MRMIQTVTLENECEIELSANVTDYSDSDFNIEGMKLFGVLVGAGEIKANLYKGIMEYCKEQYDPAKWEKCYE